MSTMLKHAAMTVLSKTLQTFLYKYLLEVDVEGVAMPSLLSSDASGWGVRLSNVQLRHGVMLMTLPGTKQRRCGQKKPKPPDNDSTDANTNTNSTNNTTSQNEKEMTKDTPFLNQQQQKQSTNGNDENTTTIMNSNMSSRAPTPPVKCSQQMMSCLNRDQTSASTADSSEDEAVNGMVPSIVRRNSRTAFMPIPTKPTTPTPTPTKTSADPLIQHNVAFDTTQLKQDHAEHFINNNNKTTNNENESTNEQTNNNEEEYDWMEQEMVLKLGTGGRIGTLDIRLVGKDLHIMVEGACLIVEACPKEEEEQSNTDTTTTSNNNTTDATEDQKTSSGGTKKTKPPTTNSSTSSSSTKKQPSELNMAERILENSVIAKALSAIPHLLLRDCTVRLIVRENSDSFGKDVGPEDTVVEFGVELFSVTSGDDFMEGFGTDEEKEKQASDVAEQTEAPRKPSLKRLEEEDENEYLLKRIRTGKGHESGISVKVYPPAGKIRGPTAKPASPAWAIHSYLERSKFCFFRCSGLDIRARIYLGKKMEIARRNNDYAWYGEEYDEYTIDSMLFGVDYIAPGPPPPLPPLNRIVSDGLHKKRATGTELYTMDENGVQSNKVRSAFHKVARGLIPTLCKKNHLPGDHCPYCWENTARPNSYSVHPLDSKTPLPGVVFSLSLHEPLEINVDRSSLEVLGNLNSLFTKKEDPAQVPTSSSADTTGNNAKHNNEEKSGSKKWSFGRHAPPKKESLKDAYPSYMVPENIEFMGVYLSKIILRLHVMRGDGRKDTHLSFRYWETVANCVTADLQSMKAKQKVFRDVRLGLGFFSMTEFRGIESTHKKLISLGLACEKASSEAVSATTKLTSKSSWPSMAALLLHVPATAESVKYESKEKHGMQMRYVSVLSKSSSVHAERSSVNIRLGVATVATNYSVIQDVSNIVSQSTQSIFGVPRTQSIPQKNRQENAVAVANDKNHQSSGLVSSSLMQYKVQIDGGSLVLAPLVHAQLPSTKFCGELSSESGMFFETVLKNMELEYGVRAARRERNEQMLTLTQLAALPESVRLRILLLLKDLSPVEKALEVTKESNSFLRCRAVNKAILLYGTQPNKAIITPKKKSDLNRPSQRQEMLAEFMKLDDHALEELWKTHQSIRNKKKALQMDK